MALFKKAVKEAAKLRMAISGPSGSGKTYTALVFATELARHGNGKIAVVDTESGSASKYADDFSFDVAELNNFNPRNYVNAIREAASAGYDVVILDSITHAWNGKGGILDIVGGNFSKWKDVAPLEREFIQTMISHDIHIIATMRAKTQYEVEKDERGKASPKKVGMGAIQRDGIEYEFDIVGMMDLQNTLTIEKTRCSAIRGEVVPTPSGRWLAPVIAWLNAGAEPAEKPVTPVTPATNGNGNGHKPAAEAPAKVLPFERVDGAEVHYNAIEWAMTQGVFNAAQHAQNSYKKLSGELKYPGASATREQTDALLWAWVEKVNAKAAEKATEAEDNPFADEAQPELEPA